MRNRRAGTRLHAGRKPRKQHRNKHGTDLVPTPSNRVSMIGGSHLARRTGQALAKPQGHPTAHGHQPDSPIVRPAGVFAELWFVVCWGILCVGMQVADHGLFVYDHVPSWAANHVSCVILQPFCRVPSCTRRVRPGSVPAAMLASSSSGGCAFATSQGGSGLTLGTYNIGATQDESFQSAKNFPIFGAKLQKDLGLLTTECDVVCIQEASSQWTKYVKDNLMPPGRMPSGRVRQGSMPGHLTV